MKDTVINQISQYIIVESIDSIKFINNQNFDNNDINDIIEYNTLKDISITNYINKNIKQTIETTQEIINTEVLEYKYGDNDTIILNNNFTKRIREIKSIIYELAIEKWDLLEDIIEKLHNELYAIEAKERRKVGRPKKKKDVENNQLSLDTFIKRKSTINNDRKMDLDDK